MGKRLKQGTEVERPEAVGQRGQPPPCHVGGLPRRS